MLIVDEMREKIVPIFVYLEQDILKIAICNDINGGSPYLRTYDQVKFLYAANHFQEASELVYHTV